jgi:hypothetical protein
MYHGGKARIGLVVARSDSPKPFEAAEEVLDQMAPLIHLEVARNVLGTISLWRDDGKSPTLIQFSADRITIEGFVGEQGCEVDVSEQGIDTDTVVPLAGQQHEPHQVAKGIDQGDDLRRQATAGPSDGLILGPSLCAGAVLVHSDDGSINDHVLEIGVFRQRCENLLEDATSCPSSEPLEDRIPLAKGFGKVAPGGAHPHNPQHSFQKEAIVRSRLPRISNFSRKKRSDAFPLLITQDHPIQDYLPIQEP